MTTINGVTAVATRARRHVDREHDRGRADDHQDVLEEEDQAVAEEEPDRLQVDRGAREELPGLVPVVEAEREPQELRVERVPHVELDSQRLAARDQAPARHEDRARRADREHERGDRVERVAALGGDRLLEPGCRSGTAIAIAAAWEPTARTIETTSDHLYGLRKPSRRTKVSR